MLRIYGYDSFGRLATANAFRTPTAPNDPYAFSYGYDAFGSTTSRTGTRWNTALPSFTATWTNGRRTNATHDASGNMTDPNAAQSTAQVMTWDAAGRPSSNQVPTALFTFNNNSESYDGDGQIVRQDMEWRFVGSNNPLSISQEHYVRSSVLGGVIIGEVMDHGSLMGGDPNRYENRSYVYLNGARLAFQQHVNPTGPNEEVYWACKNPVIGSYQENNKLTRLNLQNQPEPLENWLTIKYTDPLGSDLGIDPATLPPPPQVADPLAQLQFGDITNYGSGCTIDGVRSSCDTAIGLVNSGGGRVVSIDRWFGLYPGDPAFLPVWSASGWLPGENGDRGTNILRLEFARGFQGSQTKPTRSTTTSTKTPCDVIQPTDTNDLAVFQTLLGESEAIQELLPPERQGKDGNGRYGQNQSGTDAYYHPSGGLVNRYEVLVGMIYMVSVIQNRLTDEPRFQGKSWYNVVSASHKVKEGNKTITNYEFEGYPYGQTISQSSLSENGSEPCERARNAIAAIADVKKNGSFMTGIHNWRGIKQGKWIRPVNGTSSSPSQGAFRIANTDFW